MTTIWINAHAQDGHAQNFKTKAALKRALKEAPQHVVLTTTGEFPNAEFTVVASDLGNRPHAGGEAWQICGPDPYNKRDWYATITVNRLGNLVVK